ncbi:MAG TPA: DHH family phosphoesterase [Mogibacterium sp.]|nr:DHH family phosphoesterase [Mogibacterium sp.]
MDNNYVNQLPVPACVVGADSIIKIANHLMKNVIVYEDIEGTNFFALTGVKREVLLQANKEDVFITRNDRVFRLKTNEDAKQEKDIVVFFEETTAEESLQRKIENDKTVILFINIDNYDALISSSVEDSRRIAPTQIEGIIRKWAETYEAPVIGIDYERYVIYTNNESLDKMLEENFKVMEEVRKIEEQIDFPVSISIGIGSSEISISESMNLAEAAMELALGRGGDQAVYKNDERTKYYGGTLQTLEKNNRGKSRVIAHAMKTLINDADRVFIMGHRWPDMDAFGSAIGAYCICRHLGAEAYIVIDKYNDALDTIYEQAAETEAYRVIKSEKALKLASEKSLLIIVDVNRPGLVESRELLEACSNIVIIDHHRLAEDSIENATVAYIESYASSASELMAEILQHFSTRRIINKFEAEAMFAGIMVDSNSFSGRTGVKTFEAAAWLKRAGVDTTEVKRFFQMDKEDFTSKANAIAKAEFSDDGIAFARTKSHTGSSQVINAQVADDLLMVKGVKATFVLGTGTKGQTLISARSLGSINVHTLMEKFNGGGHFSSAGAQVKDTADNVDKMLKKYIKDYLKKYNNDTNI